MWVCCVVIYTTILLTWFAEMRTDGATASQHFTQVWERDNNVYIRYSLIKGTTWKDLRVVWHDLPNANYHIMEQYVFTVRALSFIKYTYLLWRFQSMTELICRWLIFDVFLRMKNSSRHRVHWSLYLLTPGQHKNNDCVLHKQPHILQLDWSYSL